MRLPKVETILRSGLGITVAGIGGILYFHLKQLEEISKADFVKEAFKIVRTHRGKCYWIIVSVDECIC